MFEKNQDILLHPKGATTMPTGIKVLVCDDDAAFCKKMADLVRKSQPVDGCSAAVTTCCDPIALTDKALGQFDIAFLDIDMGAYSGLELARHIRNLNLDTILIFVTNYVQYSLEGYEVQAFRYLLKSELDGKPTARDAAVHADGYAVARLLLRQHGRYRKAACPGRLFAGTAQLSC